MPGHFAHIMWVDSICNGSEDPIAHLPAGIRAALRDSLPYCKLGAASPDCPSCAGQNDATGWGQLMHYRRPSDFIQYAIPYLGTLAPGRAETQACVAWAFGYAAHLVADCTVHPVIECRLHYDELFARTRRNIIDVWTGLAAALDQQNVAQFALANADLDTGIAPAPGGRVYRA